MPMSASKRNRWLRRLAEGLVFLAVLGAVSVYQSRNLARGEAPDLSGATVAGHRIDLHRLRGEPVMVHFWATWCPICGVEQGSVDAVARDYRVVTVAMQSGDAEEITRYLEGEGVNYPVLPDPDGRLAARYGVTAVPATFFLDEQGRIRASTVGYTSEWGMRLRLWWAGL
jgi:peroxiredoxin